MPTHLRCLLLCHPTASMLRTWSRDRHAGSYVADSVCGQRICHPYSLWSGEYWRGSDSAKFCRRTTRTVQEWPADHSVTLLPAGRTYYRANERGGSRREQIDLLGVEPRGAPIYDIQPPY